MTIRASSAGVMAAATLLSACADMYGTNTAPTAARTLLATKDQLTAACDKLSHEGVMCVWATPQANPGQAVAPGVAAAPIASASPVAPVSHLSVPKDRDPRTSLAQTPDSQSYFYAQLQITSSKVVQGYPIYQGVMTTQWSDNGRDSLRHSLDDVSWNAVDRYVRTLIVDGSDQSTALAAFVRRAQADEAQAKRDEDARDARARAMILEAQREAARKKQAALDRAKAEKQAEDLKAGVRWYLVEPRYATCEPMENVGQFSDPDSLVKNMRHNEPTAHIDYSKIGNNVVLRDFSDGIGSPVNFLYAGWNACVLHATELHHSMYE